MRSYSLIFGSALFFIIGAAGAGSCGCDPETPAVGSDGGVGYDASTPVPDGGTSDASVVEGGTGTDRMVDNPDANNPNNDQIDSDCDGLSDEIEFGTTYASGERTDPGNADSDGDGLLDGVEAGRVSSPDDRCDHYSGDTSPATQTDPTNPDTDGDGLLDGEEDTNHDGAYAVGEETDPRHPDTDQDGLCDGDNDVLPLCTGGDPDPTSAVSDNDGDGIPDGVDSAPSNPDRDGDGLCDGSGSVPGTCVGGEDLDADGVIDSNETDPDLMDMDCDGVSDGDEVAAGLNPRKADTDGDLLPDGVERGQTDNLDPDNCASVLGDADPSTSTDAGDADSDGDGINDGIEDANRNGRVDDGETDPANPDTDADGLCDGPNDVAPTCVAGEDLNGNGRVDFGESDPLTDEGTTTGPSPNDPAAGTKDYDCDGLSDGEEFGNVYAGGRQTDPEEPDSDGDGIADGVEVGRTESVDPACTDFTGDADPASHTDPTRTDTDGDGLSDGDEDTDHDGAFDLGELDPRHPDTDRDGLCDGPNSVLPICTGGDPEPHVEILDHDYDGVPDANDTAPDDPDRDGDGLCDGGLDVAGVCVSGEDYNGDGVLGAGETDPDMVDSDCDGVDDFEERELGLNPQRVDSDGDMVADGVEMGRTTNLDPTNCPGFVPDAHPGSITDPLLVDSDEDGINDGVEDLDRDGQVDSGETDPTDADTDGDGLCDGPYRVIAGVCTGGEDVNANGLIDPGETDPRTPESAPADSDTDGVPDDIENMIACLDPDDPDSDGDGLCDGPPTLAGVCEGGEDQNSNGRVEETETDPCMVDTDCDGIDDGEERDESLDPLNPDTDGDGLTDGVELGRTTDLDPTNCADLFVADANGTGDTNPLVPDTDGDGVQDGAEDMNQNGQVDPGELDPTDPDDITGPVGAACGQPRAPAIHAQLATDLLLATASTFDRADTTTITDGDGAIVGLAMVDSGKGLTAFAIRKAPEGADTAAELNTIAGRIGSITVPLEQTFTSWDGFPAARGTYTFGDTQTITNRTQRAVRQALNDGGATITLSNAPSVSGPFKLGIEVVRRSAQTAIVVGVLQQLTAYETDDHFHDDMGNGSGLAQLGDQVGLQCDLFDSEINQVVDFIWVVDDSGSMDDAQAAVSAAADEMIDQLDNSTLDWRIALVTTNYPVVTPDDASTSNGQNTYCDFTTVAADFLECLDNVHADDRGWEPGFQALEEILDERFLPVEAGQDDKVRPDARVVAIFLSDAGEQSGEDVAHWIDFFGGGGNPSWDTNRADEEPIIMGGILCPRGVLCSDENSSGGSDEHEQYYLTIQGMGGVIGAISEPDGSGSASNAEIAVTVEGIMNVVIGLLTPYDLTKPPISATIKVAVEGPVDDPGQCNTDDIPRSRDDGFSYNGTNRHIAFHGACRPTSVGTEIAVSYYFWTDRSGDPDGPEDDCDCTPPEICDPDTLECYCPPDCGVGSVPPEQVCDTSTCELICRPDCGAGCTGASTCDASPSECACVCPSDCGGAAPGPGYVCDRSSSSDTFCEWICPSCPGAPSHPDMVCSPASCTWVCPDCGDCPGLSTCSDITCQCECQQTLTCNPGLIWDDDACDCVCNTALLGCEAPYVADAGICACVCAPDCGGECGDGEMCNPSVCACQCPPDCNLDTVPPEQVCNTATCELECRPDCGGTCTGSSVCNPAAGVCACECPADCGGAAPGPNFDCDQDPESATYCQWTCDACPGTPPEELMECDLNSCEWTCPDCGDCVGLASCSDVTCACECAVTLSCDDGYAWDETACDCVCDPDALGCDVFHQPDADLCACVCGPDCNGECTAGTRCNESLCLCVPDGG